METEDLIWVAGSLHSHLFWTDYRNWIEKHLPIFGAAFDLEFVIDTCISYGKDFQGSVDIMAHQLGKNPFIEDRFQKLIKTAKPNSKYEFFFSPTEIHAIYEDKEGNEKDFYIPRMQEIITENPLAHILALGLDKKHNIPGGMSALNTLLKIREEGGYAILNHALVCNAFIKKQILDFYKEGLILAAEFNGGVTIDSKIGAYLARKIGKTENPPLKKDNEKILDLEKEILIFSNNDSRCKWDVKRSAYTKCLIENDNSKPLIPRLVTAMQNESKNIKYGLDRKYIEPSYKYSGFYSIWWHGLCGAISHKTQNPSMPAL